MRLIVIAAALIMFAGSATGQTVSSDASARAQAEMHNRIFDVTNAYAAQLRLDNSVITYCRVLMDFRD